MNDPLLDAQHTNDETDTLLIKIILVYLFYGLLLFLTMYWVAHAIKVPILELPLKSIGFRLNAWIEIPFLLTGVFGGIWIGYWRLGHHQDGRFWRFILTGLLLAAATFITHVMIYQASFVARIFDKILPRYTLWGIPKEDFYVTILFYVFYMALIEIVILSFKSIKKV